MGPTEETRKDAFGNEAEHLWWVPMGFIHEFEDSLKQRFEPGMGAGSQEPDETEEILKDAFGNEAERLWWVPMEFVHEFEGGLKQRFTFKLKVAGRDEEDARDNAEGVTIDDIVDDNPGFDGLDSDEISEALDESDSVCEIDWEDLPDGALDCPLRVDNEECVEE